MKILIAGLGSIGRRHLRNLVRLGEKDIILYRTFHSTLPDEELLSFPVETDLERALAQKPEAVIISNPTALHMDVAIPAARAGCDIFLEKPISHNLERLIEFEESLEYGRGKVFVGFQFRFHLGLKIIKTLLEERAIGEILSGRVQWGEYIPEWHPWEDYRKSYSVKKDLGGGVVLTLCHPLDYLPWLLGKVEELVAFTGSIGDLEIDVEDVAEIILHFTEGAMISLHLDYFRKPKNHSLEIIGSKGIICWNNEDGRPHIFSSDLEKWETIEIQKDFERNDMFLEEMRHFLSVVRGIEKPACDYLDGKRSLELALAVYKSNKEKKFIKI